jgi:hypothetical protein
MLQIPPYIKPTFPDSNIVVVGVFGFVDHSDWKRSAISRPVNNFKSSTIYPALNFLGAEHRS